jgi:hypothetical protein
VPVRGASASASASVTIDFGPMRAPPLLAVPPTAASTNTGNYRHNQRGTNAHFTAPPPETGSRY